MELHQFFLMLAVLLLAARFLAEVSARVGIPTVIGDSPPGSSLDHRYWVGCRRMLFLVLSPVVAKLMAWVIDHFDSRSESPGWTKKVQIADCLGDQR